MSPLTRRLLFAGKCASLVYWLWFLKTILLPSTSQFDSIVAGVGPLIASVHFLQLLMVTRRMDPKASFARESALILLFGAFHIAGRVLQSRPVSSK